MSVTQRSLRAAFGAVGLMCAAQIAQAQVVTGSTAAGPTYNRRLEAAGNTCGGASGLGTAVRYSTVTFFAPSAGSFTFTAVATGWDPFLFLYSGTFNPLSPAANCVAADDDISASNLNSQFVRALTAGSSYTAVVTGYRNTDFGNWTLTVAGPSSLTVVPEAPQVLMMATGLLGVGMVARRKRSA